MSQKKNKRKRHQARLRAKAAKRSKRRAPGPLNGKRAVRKDGIEDVIVIKDKLTVRQCADDANVSTTTIHNWIKDEGLRAEKLGPKSTRITFEEWQRFKRDRLSKAPGLGGAPAA